MFVGESKESASSFVLGAVCQLKAAIVQVGGAVELHAGRGRETHSEVDGGGVWIDRKQRNHDRAIVQTR